MAGGININVGSRSSGGGSVTTTGLLKLGAALDTTLRSVTDYAGTTSPLQLSTTQVGISSAPLLLYNYAMGNPTYTTGITRAVTGDSTYDSYWTTSGTYKLVFGAESDNFIMYQGHSPNGYFAWLGKTNNTLAGNLSVGFASSNAASARLHVVGAASGLAQMIVGGSGATNISEWYNSTPNLLAYISTNGSFYAINTTNTYSPEIMTGRQTERFHITTIANGYGSRAGTSTNSRWACVVQDTERIAFETTGQINITNGTISSALNINTIVYTASHTSGTVTGLFLNATESGMSGTHNLMDLQVGGSSKFRVLNNGNVYLGNAAYVYTTVNGGFTVDSYNSTLQQNTLILYGSNIFTGLISGGFTTNQKLAVNRAAFSVSNPAALEVQGSSTNDIQRWYKADGTTLVNYIDQNGAFYSRGLNMATGGYTIVMGNNCTISPSNNSGFWEFTTGQGIKFNTANTLALHLDTSQNATFAGAVQATAGSTTPHIFTIGSSSYLQLAGAIGGTLTYGYAPYIGATYVAGFLGSGSVYYASATGGFVGIGNGGGNSGIQVKGNKVRIQNTATTQTPVAQLEVVGNSTDDIQRWYKSDGTTLAGIMTSAGQLNPLELLVSSSGLGVTGTGMLITGNTINQQNDYLYLANANNRIILLNSHRVSNVGIYLGGTGTAPTALIHLTAGTASAGTAPIKLTAGTNLTTPEDGVFEYDGTNLYFTVGSTRKTVTLV